MDPLKLKLRHVDDIQTFWYGPAAEGENREPQPGWLLEGVEGDTDNVPFLDDHRTQTDYDSGGPKRTRIRVDRTTDQVKEWAGELINKLEPYRVTCWTPVRDGDTYDNPDSYIPELVEEQHSVVIVYGDAEDAFTKADLGNDRAKLDGIIARLGDPDGVITIRREPGPDEAWTTRTVHIPVRNVQEVIHTMTERQVTHEFEVTYSAIGSCGHCYRPRGGHTHTSVTA